LSHIEAKPNVLEQSAFSRSELAISQPSAHRHSMCAPRTLRRQPKGLPNLDYLSFGSTGENGSGPLLMPNGKEASNPADWQRLLSTLDNGQTTIWDGIYGGPGGQTPSLADLSSVASTSPDATVSCDRIDNTYSTDGFSGSASWSPADVWAPVPDISSLQQVHVPQSVLSFGSDEGDEWGDMHLPNTSSADDGFCSSISIPNMDSPMMMGTTVELAHLSGLEFGFGL